MPKDDEIIWAFITTALAHFAAQVGWALAQPWVTFAANSLSQ